VGWRLAHAHVSSVFDTMMLKTRRRQSFNPTPTDVKPRVRALAINETDATSSLETAFDVAASFGLVPSEGKTIAREVAQSGARLVLDPPPTPEFATEFVHKVGKSSRDSSRVEVPFAHVAPPEPEPVPCTTVDGLVGAYRRYLAGERGLVAGTVRLRERVARLFLSGLSEPVEEHLSRLDGAEVAAFVLRECPGRSVSGARTVVSGTRSLLRFLYLEGYLPRRLDAGVPGMAGWSMTALPRAVDPQLAARLVASCDPATAAGRRDRAIVVLLARLGLRGQEVADLELDDIDWRAGEVVIRGKGHSRDRLPLPADVGEAVAGYLRYARPPSASRRLFLSARAPRAPLSASAVRSVVRDACRRAGLPRIGAHRLRHMTGTEMLRAGASLAEVGQVLRQRSALVTSNYARVDRTALRALARPWPGGA